MNKLLLTLVLLITLSGCGNYDSGYSDGYDEASKKFVIFGAGSYNTGYSDGEEDAYYYDLGYRDVQNNEAPRYPDMEEYMEGYRKGQ